MALGMMWFAFEVCTRCCMLISESAFERCKFSPDFWAFFPWLLVIVPFFCSSLSLTPSTLNKGAMIWILSAALFSVVWRLRWSSPERGGYFTFCCCNADAWLILLVGMLFWRLEIMSWMNRPWFATLSMWDFYLEASALLFSGCLGFGFCFKVG